MGTYYPSAFSMFLNKPSSEIDITDSTFIHEYIHFLQDLILPYCIRQNMVFVSSFTHMVRDGHANKYLNRPFDRWTKDHELTRKQQFYTWGMGDKTSNGHIFKIVKDSFTSEYGHNIYRYCLRFDDGIDYLFGARDFLEYIAHKIQNKFWTTCSPTLPYKTIDKLFDFFQLQSVPESVRLLIAEYCLLNDNPAHMLIKIFFEDNLILSNPKSFTDYSSCSDFLLNMGWISNGGFSESVMSKTDRRLNDFVNSLTAVYPQKQFDSIKDWIITTNNICKTTLANKFLLSSLYNLSKEELLYFIKHMIDKIGIPLILFNDNTITSALLPSHYDQDQFVDFYVMQQFVFWMEDNQKICPIKDICKANYSFYSPNCNRNPLNANTECIFSQFLHSYGLDQCPIITSSN